MNLFREAAVASLLTVVREVRVKHPIETIFTIQGGFNRGSLCKRFF